MDQSARIAHLQSLLSEHASLMAHLEANRDKLKSHHQSRERDRALLHAEKSLRRAEKLQRRLDRAMRNESKQHSG